MSLVIQYQGSVYQQELLLVYFHGEIDTDHKVLFITQCIENRVWPVGKPDGHLRDVPSAGHRPLQVSRHRKQRVAQVSLL